MIFEVQHEGTNIEVGQVEQAIKKLWKKSGRKVSDIKSIRAYYVPKQLNTYFIINEGELTGTISSKGLIEEAIKEEDK